MKSTIENIINKHKNGFGEIIPILEDIQSRYGYLPENILKTVAQKTRHSLVDIYGVATFYKYFSLKPRGDHLISVCMGTACHVRQSPVILKEFQNQLGIDAGETTSDKKFTLETVNCLGACARGPIVVIDGHYFSNVKKTQVKQILKNTLHGLDKTDVRNDQRIFPVKLRCPHCNHSLQEEEYIIDGSPAIRLTVSFGQKHGWIRLSSLYGSYSIKSEYKIPKDTIVNFFCPHLFATRL